MIEMSFADALFTYLLLWILFIGILWCRELARVKNFDWKVSNSRLFHCDNCHHSFIVKDNFRLRKIKINRPPLMPAYPQNIRQRSAGSAPTPCGRYIGENISGSAP